MVGRGELTDRAWTTIEPLLPVRGRRGGQWRDHRTVINGILWKLRHRRAVARFTVALWRMADVRGSAPSLARRGAVGSSPHPRADQIGCRGRGGVGSQHRQFDSTGTSACKWSQASSESRR